MSDTQARPAVIAVLEEIASWKAAADNEFSQTMGKVDSEEDEARRQIEEAQRRLLALASVRAELRDKHTQVGFDAEQKERTALRSALSNDRSVVEERAIKLAKAIAEREAALQKQLQDPDIASAVEEFEKFVEIEATLAALPPTYRRAILDHHEKVRRRLEPVIAASNAGPPDLGLDQVGVGVLLAISPAEGTPDALVAVVPVPFEVQSEWTTRKEDLASQFAYRVVAAISRLLNAVGAGAAPIEYNSVNGCLAIQVWLGDSSIQGDLNERGLEEIGALREEAEELSAAGIELYGFWVRPAMLAEEEN